MFTISVQLRHAYFHFIQRQSCCLIYFCQVKTKVNYYFGGYLGLPFRGREVLDIPSTIGSLELSMVDANTASATLLTSIDIGNDYYPRLRFQPSPALNNTNIDQGQTMYSDCLTYHCCYLVVASDDYSDRIMVLAQSLPNIAVRRSPNSELHFCLFCLFVHCFLLF